MKNSSKGTAKLASVIQSRMEKVIHGSSSILIDKGEILAKKKLKFFSIPDAIIEKNVYSVCAGVQEARPLEVGDQVLVLWTFDGDPVVIDKIVQADTLS